MYFVLMACIFIGAFWWGSVGSSKTIAVPLSEISTKKEDPDSKLFDSEDAIKNQNFPSFPSYKTKYSEQVFCFLVLKV